VLGFACRVGVQQADVEGLASGPFEPLGEIVAYVASAIADAMDVNRLPTDLDRHRLDCVRTEDGNPAGPLPDRRPAVERVVVAVHDQRLYSGRRQALQSVEESQLRPYATLRAVVDIAGDDK